MKLRVLVLAVCVAAAFGLEGAIAQDAGGAGETISLDQAIQKAVSGGMQAQINALQAQGNINSNEQTHAKNGWTVSSNAGYTHSDVLPGTTGNGTEDVQATVNASGPTTSVSLTGDHSIVDNPVTNTTKLTLSANQTIWDGYPGGQKSAANAIADIGLAQQKLAANSTQLGLVYQVKQEYYNVASAQATARLDQQIVKQRQTELDQTNALFSAGRVSQIDVLQAQINLDQAQVNADDAANSLTTSRKTLSTLMGMTLDSAYSVQEITDVSVPTDALPALIQKAYDQRTDLQQLLSAGKTAEINKSLAKAATSPVVIASGQVGISHGWEAATTSGTWSAGVKVSLPIVDSGLTKLKIDQADADLKSNRLQIEQLRQTIATNVEADYNSVVSLNTRLALAQKNLQLQQKNYELTQTQFQQGLKSNLDVLTASVSLTSSETSVQQAKTQLQLAILKLQSDIGA